MVHWRQARLINYVTASRLSLTAAWPRSFNPARAGRLTHELVKPVQLLLATFTCLEVLVSHIEAQRAEIIIIIMY
jgi:hypothetical protein